MRWISLLALTCVLFAASCSVEADEFQKVSNSTADLTGVIAEYLSWNSSTAVWNEKTVETAQDYLIPPDLMQRQSNRILDGADYVCQFLERYRQDQPSQI